MVDLKGEEAATSCRSECVGFLEHVDSDYTIENLMGMVGMVVPLSTDDQWRQTNRDVTAKYNGTKKT